MSMDLKQVTSRIVKYDNWFFCGKDEVNKIVYLINTVDSH